MLPLLPFTTVLSRLSLLSEIATAAILPFRRRVILFGLNIARTNLGGPYGMEPDEESLGDAAINIGKNTAITSSTVLSAWSQILASA